MTVTDRCAYEAICLFIERYWKRTGRPDAIGSLLGDLWQRRSKEGRRAIQPAGQTSSSAWRKPAPIPLRRVDDRYIPTCTF